jgi:hypothetical protein
MFQVLKIIFCIILVVWTIGDFIGVLVEDGDKQFEYVVQTMYVNPFLVYLVFNILYII